MRQRKKSARLTLLLAGLPLAGCESGSAIQTPFPSKSLAQLTKPVPVYSKAPCWMQQAWSADNSRKATAKSGKVVAYAPPCVTDKKQSKPSTDDQPKSS